MATVLFLVAATLATISATDTEPGPTVLVAARDLPLGTTLQSDDVRSVNAPDAWDLQGALGDPSDVVGQQLIGQARAGEPLTDMRIADHRPSDPGTEIVPVRLADDGVTELLRPGTRVDVVTASVDEEHDTVLAEDVTVFRVTDSPDASEIEPPNSDSSGPLVLFSAQNTTASRLAAASLDQPVTVTLH